MEPTSFTGSQPPSDKSAGYLRITSTFEFLEFYDPAVSPEFV
jgi:hypothetical protein